MGRWQREPWRGAHHTQCYFTPQLANSARNFQGMREAGYGTGYTSITTRLWRARASDTAYRRRWPTRWRSVAGWRDLGVRVQSIGHQLACENAVRRAMGAAGTDGQRQIAGVEWRV